MDANIDVTHGPSRVQPTGTVTVPKELLREIGVEPGTDRVLWALNPAIPGTLILIPAKQMASVMPGVIELLGRSG